MNVSTRMLLGCAAAIAATLCACHHDKPATVAPATRVKTIAVGSDVISGTRAYSGTVEESTGVALSFAAPGTIRQFNVAVGDRVAKGQLIATLDAATLQNTYNMAQATLNEAQDAYNRMKQLHEANALPDMQWVQVQNTLEQARNAAAIARKGLNDANLYAPRSGYVSEKLADAGVNVAPGIPVVKIVDINPVKVNISVPENEIASITPGTNASITVGAIGGKTFSGRLAEKGVAANPLSRAYDVKFDVANPDGELLPGMICDVAMAIGGEATRQAIVVPADAVMLDADNLNFVWLAIDGKAAKRVVDVEGMTSGSRLVIKSGLQPGDSLIVSGQQKVSSGTPVVSVNNSK